MTCDWTPDIAAFNSVGISENCWDWNEKEECIHYMVDCYEDSWATRPGIIINSSFLASNATFLAMSCRRDGDGATGSWKTSDGYQLRVGVYNLISAYFHRIFVIRELFILQTVRECTMVVRFPTK